MEKITIGLVPAPQFPAKLVKKFSDQLEDDLQDAFSKKVCWEVKMKIDRITGAADTVKAILDEAKYLKEKNNWDYVISLTDLPLFHNKCVVIADADTEGKNALISLPAFGITPTVKKVKLTVLHMVRELYYQNSDTEDDVQFIQNGIGIKTDPERSQVLKRFLNVFRFSTIQRIHMPKKKDDISIRFLIKPKWGRLPITLSGMTIANQPWRIMFSFKKMVGLAFATGSYMLIFTTLWELSSLYSLMRHVLVMSFAIIGMTAWTIIAHNLWEKHDANNTNAYRFIYNLSTILTLLVSVSVFYICLFSLFLIAVVIFVPPDMFEKVINHEVGVTHYLRLVWLITSAATVAGAIGAGLEDAESVRKSTYGYRQYIRTKASEEEKKEDEKYNNK